MQRLLLVCCSIVALGGASLAAPKPEYPARGPDIFDPKASGAVQVAGALATAKREEKRVLILFGANWCPWCRRLHAALTGNKAVQARLAEKFVLVFVDANTRHDRNRNAAVLERYGNPTLEFGLPVFVMLASDGKQLTTRETASLAADTDAGVAERVLAFLNQWSK